MANILSANKFGTRVRHHDTNARVILYNFVQDRGEYTLEDPVSVTGLEDGLEEGGGMVCGGTVDIWDKVADYSVSDVGAVSWQLSKI